VKPAARALGAIAAMLAATGVAAAAMGSHALPPDAGPEVFAVWSSAVLIHLFHAAALLGVAALAARSASPWVARGAAVVLAGLVLFCASLYWRVLSGAATSGPTAPLGGMLMMAGWLLVALALAFSSRRE
jgi:uncharacterized membrane protein YgdD (TMEM256/DUF423 family)